MLSSPIHLDRRSKQPLQRQVREHIRDAIIKGRLKPGQRLPSWDELAGELSIARGTVKAAYDWLGGEGLIAGRGARGTYVTGNFNRNPQATAEAQADPPTENRPGGWSVAPLPFQPGVPAMDAFPRVIWARLASRAARNLTAATMAYPDPAGWLPLRQAIADYVGSARGVACRPPQIFITAGYTGAIDLIGRALGGNGAQCWVEDPGFFRARDGLASAGMRLVAVPVDAEGIDVARGIALAPHAQFAVVTPSHQAPLGMAMSLARRSALLQWAATSGAWIVEDDYFGEFRVQGRATPALASLDGPLGPQGRTLYVGSFSKVVMPALRLGYVIAPAAQAARFAEVASLLTPAPASATQMALADFIHDGHFARHIRRMMRVYAERRGALAGALQAAFGDTARIDLKSNGMHLLMYFRPGQSDIELARRAVAAGLGAVALSPWTIERQLEPALILSFTNIPAAQAGIMADRLKSALED